MTSHTPYWPAAVPPQERTETASARSGSFAFLTSPRSRETPPLAAAGGGFLGRDRVLALVARECALQEVADATSRGCTQAIRKAQEASKRATHRLMKLEVG